MSAQDCCDITGATRQTATGLPGHWAGTCERAHDLTGLLHSLQGIGHRTGQACVSWPAT